MAITSAIPLREQPGRGGQMRVFFAVTTDEGIVLGNKGEVEVQKVGDDLDQFYTYAGGYIGKLYEDATVKKALVIPFGAPMPLKYLQKPEPDEKAKAEREAREALARVEELKKREALGLDVDEAAVAKAKQEANEKLRARDEATADDIAGPAVKG